MPYFMRINDDLALLPLEAQTIMGTSTLNLALLTDPTHGPVLIDTSIPNQLPAIEDALRAEGQTLTSLRTVLITHHDIDHIGSLPQVVEASAAEVLAAADEIPYIQGRRGQKLPPPEGVEAALERFPAERRDMVRAIMNQPVTPVHVARALSDGEVLEFVGGVRVVLTPGHTVGHTSFYLERSGVLIAGDALSAQDGQLSGPFPLATADLPTALASVRKLAALQPSAILCYHGGLVTDDAAGQLRRLADSVA